MKYRFKLYLTMVMLALLAGMTIASCNKDDSITADKPVITLDSETGVYEVRAGNPLTIAPRYENAGEARYRWTLDGETIAETPALTRLWESEGTFYLTLTVTADGGNASEEMRVDVLPNGKPVISLPIDGDRVTVLRNTPFMIAAEVAGSTVEGFKLEWKVDGRTVGSELSYTFESREKGDFKVEVSASNADGSDSRQFTIAVVDRLPVTVEFLAPTYFTESDRRYTFPGRQVVLVPVIGGEATSYIWTVNGVRQECDKPVFSFSSDTPGTYNVALTLNGGSTAGVEVEVVDATEQSRRRAGSSSEVKVLEYVPAPGQFIGDTQTGGMTGMELTHESACRWAAGRLAKGAYVSLGGFGGYIILALNHSIACGDSGYDFSITGNAFLNDQSSTGGSNEPGIVYVMQDVNGNGLPDDEWYELLGSETDSPDTRRDYAVTYFRPAGTGMNVQWTDNYGGSGSIDYLADFHKQPYYYPAWIPATSYTLRGTCLKSKTEQDPATGYWNNNPFGWGYADNMGSDLVDSSAADGEGRPVGFRISNAVYPDGTPVKLLYADFIKIQTGVNSKAGWLGEVSTEILGLSDLRK